ncbi:hypothetical protein SEA_AMYEV_66 [Arthrobacter phage Amyev]|uniref:HNH endonuclease n=1 Tax=Arthrobacter phage Amyev TaxID=2832315 RepID=A0AA48Y3W0_9CAUD|nr:HNH endonuclease [Arthrobacter phage Amyev]UIW13481.1 hypothetical protein SEA_AMYEV_66 [Arthrobacter phage Amyev]
MRACCAECAYPGNPGVCVESGSCPCHDTEDAPLAGLSAAALERRAYRLRHSGKTCDRCKETKRLSAFGVNARERDGLNRTCKPCRNAAERERVNAHLL